MRSLAPEESTYLRTVFLERVAHELRGPLAVVDGAMQELEHDLGADAASHRPLFQMMKRAIRRLARTADRLQQTGMCEREELVLEQQRCDLIALVRGSVDEAVLNEPRRALQVQVHVPESPQLCDVDGRWMSIALYEIACNAIRHARERVTVSLEPCPGELRVSFADDSRIAAEFEPARFRPTARGERGLGLALALVRDVVAAHGGDLVIERGAAAPGAGEETRVCVRIPVVQEEVRAQGATL